MERVTSDLNYEGWIYEFRSPDTKDNPGRESSKDLGVCMKMHSGSGLHLWVQVIVRASLGGESGGRQDSDRQEPLDTIPKALDSIKGF